LFTHELIPTSSENACQIDGQITVRVSPSVAGHEACRIALIDAKLGGGQRGYGRRAMDTTERATAASRASGSRRRIRSHASGVPAHDDES
jgi:hypothetical protein